MRETTTESEEFDNNERRYLISVIRRHFSCVRSQLLLYYCSMCLPCVCVCTERFV